MMHRFAGNSLSIFFAALLVVFIAMFMMAQTMGLHNPYHSATGPSHGKDVGANSLPAGARLFLPARAYDTGGSGPGG